MKFYFNLNEMKNRIKYHSLKLITYDIWKISLLKLNSIWEMGLSFTIRLKPIVKSDVKYTYELSD